MGKNNNLVNINNLPWTSSNHDNGIKKIIFTSGELKNNITQIAFGELSADQNIESHCHPTMDEYFYITNGEGIFIVNGEKILVAKGDCIQITATAWHSITAISKLNFFYFGVAI